MSPEGAKSLQKILLDDPSAKRISVAIQETPAGMGDAVMKGRETWQKFNDLCVIWGDQVHVSQDTLKRSIAAHTNTPAPRLTLPLVRMDKPYVEYCFDEGGRLERILQSREGDSCHPGGLGDIGTFLLSVNGLESSWRAYEKSAPRGEKTGEINFLPFLVYLTQNNWNCTQVMIGDADEARGINTPQDLEYFRRLYKT